MWGIRVIIPVKLRNKMLDELQNVHVGHIGIVKMKELSRSFFWWPKLDSDIEQLARNVQDARFIKRRHQKLHFILGNGPPHPGNGYTLISLAHSWDICFSSL